MPGTENTRPIYRIFDTAAEMLKYEKTLVDVSPNHALGKFTYYLDFVKYVWTTFDQHQWDLNCANPEIFSRLSISC